MAAISGSAASVLCLASSSPAFSALCCRISFALGRPESLKIGFQNVEFALRLLQLKLQPVDILPGPDAPPG